MTLTAAPSSIARLRRIRFLALALLGLVIGHDAVYLAMYGSAYHEAMARSGHGYWLTFALLATVLAGVPLVAALLALRHLRLAVGGRRVPVADRSARAVERKGAATLEFVGTLPRLYVVITLGFTIQENVEQTLAGHALPGLFVLDPPLVLPVLFGIAILLSLAGTWLRWRETVLRARLAAVEASELARRLLDVGRTPGARWAEVGATIASKWLASRPAGRAPPIVAAA